MARIPLTLLLKQNIYEQKNEFVTMLEHFNHIKLDIVLHGEGFSYRFNTQGFIVTVQGTVWFSHSHSQYQLIAMQTFRIN